MALTSCTTCQEVVDASACRCPHCDATLRECRAVRPAAMVLLGLALAACDGGGVSVQPEYGMPATDDDGDGYFLGEDCDDADPDVNPGATEDPSNGIDDDCDGEIDEGAAG